MIAIGAFHFKYVDWDCGIQPEDGSQGPTLLLRFTASAVFSPHCITAGWCVSPRQNG